MIVQKKLKYQDDVSCEEVNEIAFLDLDQSEGKKGGHSKWSAYRVWIQLSWQLGCDDEREEIDVALTWITTFVSSCFFFSSFILFH